MYLDINPETGTIWVFDKDGNPLHEASSAEQSVVPSKRAFFAEPEEEEEDEEEPGEETLLPGQADAFRNWNESANKRPGLPTLTRDDALRARVYTNVTNPVTGENYTFFESLGVYAAYILGAPGVMSPSDAEVWATPPRTIAEVERQGEIDKLRRRAGLPPVGGPPAAPSAPGAEGGPAPPAEGAPERAAMGFRISWEEAKDTAVGRAIASITDDPRIRQAMLEGALREGVTLEGPWGTDASGAHVGDDGDAVGPWQVNFGPVNDPNQDGVRERGDGTNISREQAADPRKAAAWMLSEYELAVKRVDQQYPGLWESDPQAATTLAIFHAERPQGYPSGGNWQAATPEMAASVYGGGAPGGGAAGGAAGGGGALAFDESGYPIIPTEPGAEGVPSLTPDEHVQWTEYDIAFDMPQNVFKAALAQGIDPLAYWFDLQEQALDVALEADQITREEYDEAKDLRLSTDQILVARDLALDLQTYRDLAIIGVSDAAIAQFQSWGVEPDMYLWARTQGALSHAQIQQTVQEGGDLVEAVAENRMPEEDERRFAEFNRAWDAEERKLPFKLVTDPDFALWRAQQREAAWEAEQEALDARRERTEARLRSEIGGTVPGAPTAAAAAPPGTTPIIGATPERAAFDGKTGAFVSAEPVAEEKIEPYKAPEADLLMLQAAREVPMMRDATPQEMREGVFRGATRQVLGGPLAGPKVMPARHRLTTFGSFAMGPRYAQAFLRGPVSTRNPAQARRAEETRRRIVEARPEIADMEEEERRRYNLPRTRATPIPQP